MERFNWNNLLCRICLGTLLTLYVICVGVGLNRLVRHSFRNDLTDVASAAPQDESEIDWEALYPFETSRAEPENVTEKADMLKTLKEAVITLKLYLQTCSSRYLPGYHIINELANGYERLLGWNYASVAEYNGAITLPDGHLTTYLTYKNTSGMAKAAIAFAEYCEGTGADFLYVNAPFKICRYDDAKISGNVDFSNQNADELLNALDSAGVKTYDLRDEIHRENLSHHSLFYRTDHHWLAETGLWASRHILERLRDEYGYAVEPSVLDEEKFRKETYAEWFLGSHGKKLTLALAKPDDISLLYPLYPTELHFEIPALNLDVTGDFSVLYDMEAIEERDYYQKDPYAAYSYGGQALERIENKQADNDIKALFVHDSFGDSVTPFLALAIQHMETIDPRHFTGSLERYIKENKPDIVIVLYNPSVFVNPDEGFFNFK